MCMYPNPQAKAQAPELKKFMEKRMHIKLNGNRKISGVLRGFDQFMNLVLEDTVEEVSAAEKHDIGMVVRGGLARSVSSPVGEECPPPPPASPTVRCPPSIFQGRC
jgi:small nuclear ribonucleoprotein G